MFFREEVMEATADLRTRVTTLAKAAMNTAREQADASGVRVARLRKSIGVLSAARIEFQKVARRHVSRFVKRNSPLLAAVRKDVSDLARSTYRTIADGEAPKARRRATASRRRGRKAA